MKTARMPGTTPLNADHAASKSDRKVASAAREPGAAGSRSASAKATAIADHRAGRDPECRRHPEDPPEHQKHDRANAHLKRHGAGRERSVSGWHDVGHERVERRPLEVDAGVEHDHRADQPGQAQRRRRGEHAIAAAASRKPASTIDRRPRPRAVARSEAAPAQGTSRRRSTLSMAITAPIAVR